MTEDLHVGNGWNEWSRYVLFTLREINETLKSFNLAQADQDKVLVLLQAQIKLVEEVIGKMQAEYKAQEKEVINLRIKTATWSGIAAVIGTILTIAAYTIAEKLFK